MMYDYICFIATSKNQNTFFNEKNLSIYNQLVLLDSPGQRLTKEVKNRENFVD